MWQVVTRFDTARMDQERRDALVELARTLALNPDELTAKGAVFRDGNEYELCLQRVVGDEPAPGEIKSARLDHVSGRVVTEPVVVPLGAELPDVLAQIVAEDDGASTDPAQRLLAEIADAVRMFGPDTDVTLIRIADGTVEMVRKDGDTITVPVYYRSEVAA